MTQRRHKKAFPVWSWVLLVAWIAVIWGHSLINGENSAAESYRFVALAQKAVYGIYQMHIPLFERLAEAHPHFLLSLTDESVMHFYVRKAGHFSEYFVLGILAFNAVRRTFSNPFLAVLAIGIFWAGTPCMDEYIQLHVPDRSGQLTDVLIDMAGFGTSLVLCLLIAAVVGLIGALFGALFGRGDDLDYDEEPVW